MIEQTVDIATPDGACTTFIAHPDRGGPHPAVLFYMDAPGIREELRDMARRLASAGYYVVLPNMYYRAGVMELGVMDGSPGSDWLKRMFALMRTLTIPMVMSDTKALLAYIDTQSAANKGKVGAVGYCMSGRYAISAAATFPDRVTAAASFYGVSLVTDQADSPHLATRNVKGEIYVACANTDPYAPPEMIDAVRAELLTNGEGGDLRHPLSIHAEA